MKTRYIKMLTLPLLAACTWSCSDSLIDDDSFLPVNDGDGKLIKEVVIRMPELKTTTDTRTVFIYNDETNQLTAQWGWDDVIGVVPVDYSASFANQVKFPLSQGSWTQDAKFDGGAWSLKADVRYGAYSPFSVANYEKEPSELTLSYEGQVQQGRDFTEIYNLGKYDYMAAPAGYADENGSITFEMQRLGGVVGFRFLKGLFYKDGVGYYGSAPTKLVLSAETAVFGVEQKLDLTGDVPVMTSTLDKKSITLNLQDFYFMGEEELDSYAYLMLPPMDATNITLSVYMEDGTQFYTNIENFKVEAGAFNPYVIESVTNRSEETIVFADENTKKAVLEALGLPLDGELTYGQAAAVTEFSFVPRSDYASKMTSFDEFQYFTGLTELSDCLFIYSTDMVSVTLPESITTIGIAAFSPCSKLTSIELPAGVTTIGRSAFFGCTSLTQINLPRGITYIPEDAFYNCTSLASIELPENLDAIGGTAFCNTGLTEITIPARVTSIGSVAFGNTSSLAKVTFLGATPPALGENLISGYADPVLYVPYWNYDTYRYNNYFVNNNLQDYIDAYVAFVDDIVRDICEANFDKNGDGKVSIKDLGKVTNQEVFGKFQGTDIIWFDEFHYFTGLTWNENNWLDGGNQYTQIFSHCHNLENIWLPDECTSIFSSMFAFTNLGSIDIPGNVTFIGSDAFFGCNNLYRVHLIWSTKVPTLTADSAFHMSENGDDIGINPELEIYVPADLIDAFKAADNWKEYADHMVEW